MDSVAGSDVNPYAVAIAKFRLTLSFIEKSGYARLKDAPKLPLHVVVRIHCCTTHRWGSARLGHAWAECQAWKGSEFS